MESLHVEQDVGGHLDHDLRAWGKGLRIDACHWTSSSLLTVNIRSHNVAQCAKGAPRKQGATNGIHPPIGCGSASAPAEPTPRAPRSAGSADPAGGPRGGQEAMAGFGAIAELPRDLTGIVDLDACGERRRAGGAWNHHPCFATLFPIPFGARFLLVHILAPRRSRTRSKC